MLRALREFVSDADDHEQEPAAEPFLNAGRTTQQRVEPVGHIR